MLKIGSVVINCKDFGRTAAFWQEALQYVPRGPADDDWVVLKDPEGIGPNLSVQQTDELKFGKNRLHVDLYATDQAAEVERLLKIGATVHRPAEDGEDFEFGVSGPRRVCWHIRRSYYERVTTSSDYSQVRATRGFLGQMNKLPQVPAKYAWPCSSITAVLHLW